MWSSSDETKIVNSCKGMTPNEVFVFFKKIVTTRFPHSFMAKMLPKVTLKKNRWRDLEDMIRNLDFAIEPDPGKEFYWYYNAFISALTAMGSPHDQHRKRARELEPNNPCAGGIVSRCSSCWRFVFHGYGGNRRTSLCPEHHSTNEAYKRPYRAKIVPAKSPNYRYRIDELKSEELARTQRIIPADYFNWQRFHSFMRDETPFAPETIKPFVFHGAEIIRRHFPLTTRLIESKGGNVTDPLSIVTTLEYYPCDEPEEISIKRNQLYECIVRDFGLYRTNLIHAEAWERLWEERKQGGLRKNAGRPRKSST